MKTINDFAMMSFNKQKMKEKLPYPIYLKWKDAVRKEKDLDRETADAIAHAMKEWAIANGATHYAHWFTPLNGVTAKKHDAFIDRASDNEPIYRFSGRELIKGEPDASSFPSGGMRSTFEARGYTYWDLTANSFIINHCLYIPTIFVSYYGEQLDKRGPLLHSVAAVSDAGKVIVNLFEKREHTYRIRPKVGLEQEFFLVDKALGEKRADLVHCGRTLFGRSALKGQEFDDHYFGQIPSRVEEYYQDVNQKLWALGVYAKAEHNEVAPCQFEIASLYENVNVAIDDNQLCMGILQQTALAHNMICLLHEKPFQGVNGSGKHNNYSLVTNWGFNCFDPGEKPYENNVFLLFVAALIQAVDRYSALLRVSSSSTSNDYRLGGDEAPPSIISIYMGSDLEAIFNAIACGESYHTQTRRALKGFSLKEIPRDSSDRNRTSTMAYTGNKFEFRMLGSSKNAAEVNIVLNAGIAESLRGFADALVPLAHDPDALRRETLSLVQEVMKEHGRIIYSGDNYSACWKEEASVRGLKSYPTFYDALMAVKTLDLNNIFVRPGIFTQKELEATFDVHLEETIKYHALEARTMIDMAIKDIAPGIKAEIIENANVLRDVSVPGLEEEQKYLTEGLQCLYERREDLKRNYERIMRIENKEERAGRMQRELIQKMAALREIADDLEGHISRKANTLPGYEELFNSLD